MLCLALLHHLVIGADIPLSELLDWFDWFAELGGDPVVEFAMPEDHMVEALLRNRDERYAEYDLGTFEHQLSARFRILGRQRLQSGPRHLFDARPCTS